MPPLDAALDPFAAAGFVPETTTRPTPTPAPASGGYDPFIAAGFVPEATKATANPIETAAAPAPTSAQPAPQDQLAWTPEGSAVPLSHPADNPAVRIGAAAVRGAQEGFGEGPVTILSPAAQEKLDEIQRRGGWTGSLAQLASTIGTDLDTAGRALGAIMRGGQAAVAQTGAEVGMPQLGRDIAALPEAFPTGDMGGGTLHPGGPARTIAEQRAIQERINSVTAPQREGPGVTAPPTALTPPPEPPAATLAAEPVPAGWRQMAKGEPLAPGQEVATNPETGIQYVRDNSAGAQVTNPRNIPNATPAQRANAEAQSVQQTHIDRAGPARVDPAVYIEGVEPTRGAVDPYGRTPDGSLNAVAEKALAATDPDFKSNLDHKNVENNTTRKDAFMEHAQDQNAIARQEEVRQEHWDANEATQIAASNPADPADVRAHVEAIDEILRGGAGKRSAVETMLNDVRSKFFRDPLPTDPEGTTEWDRLETDPAQLIGARQNIADKLSSVGQKDSNARTATRQLETVLHLTDDLIEKSSPGYEKMRTDWRNDSIPIDQMRELQKYLSGGGKITDAHGVLQFNAVQKMLEKIISERRKPGINNAKSLSDEQIDMMIRLRNDLARDSYRDYVARTKGSDTTQQLTTAQRIMQGARKQAATVAEAAAHGVIGSHLPYIGNIAVRGTAMALKARNEAKAAAHAEATKRALGRSLLSSHPTWEGPAY